MDTDSPEVQNYIQEHIARYGYAQTRQASLPDLIWLTLLRLLIASRHMPLPMFRTRHIRRFKPPRL
jgi:hypothetical protein